MVKYLHTHVGPRLFGGDLVVEDPGVFTAAAGLTEMAGWMAHDAGRDDRAYSHFLRAFHLSKAGQDRQLGVHTLASLSHLAHHRADSNEAIRFAQAGEASLAEGPANPGADRPPSGYASEGTRRFRRRTVRRTNSWDGRRQLSTESARKLLPNGSADLTLAAWPRGRTVHAAAGQAGGAQAHAQRILELRPSNRTRSRAFGQLFLIAALIEQGEPEEACQITRDVVEATQSLGSYLVIQQFQEIHDQLTPYADLPGVGETRQILADTVRQRIWLQEWITSDALESQVTSR